MKNYNIQFTLSAEQIQAFTVWAETQELGECSIKEVVDPFVGWSQWVPILDYKTLPIKNIGLYCALYAERFNPDVIADPMARKNFYIGETAAMYDKGKKGGLCKRIEMLKCDITGQLKSSNHKGKFFNNVPKILKNSSAISPFSIHNVYVAVRPYPDEYIGDKTTLVAHESRLMSQFKFYNDKLPICSINGK